jgi:hypothetical protein
MQKRTVKILKIVAIILVVLSLIYAIAVGVSSAKLRKAYAVLEKAGRPMEPADVIPPDVPDAENAALLYESAILLLKAQPAPDGNLLEYLGESRGETTVAAVMGAPPDGNLLEYLGELSDKFLKDSIEPDELAELQQLIEQDVVTQALSVVEQGSQRRSCRFDRDYKAGFNMLMPNLGGFRNVIRIIGAKSCLEAQAGRPDAAWDLVQTQLRLADAMRNEPILIHFLVRLASIRNSCDTIHKICEISPPNSEQYHIIESLLFDYEDRTPLVLALDGERLLCGEWAFNLLKNGSDEDMKSLTASAGVGFGEVLLNLYSAFKPLFLADHAAYVQIMGDYTRLIQQPYSPNEANAMIRKVEETRSRLYVITSILELAAGRVNELYAELIAQMRITRAGLALLQEKKTNGVFPETIEKLKIENLDDPFSKKLLRYKPQGQGFILYSIGRDEKDNDGSPRQKKQEKDWDIVWSYTGER